MGWRIGAIAVVMVPGAIQARVAPRSTPPVTTPAPIPPAAPALLIPADTPVEIEFLATLSSSRSVPGDHFPIRLLDDVMLGNAIVIPAGTLGVGEVVEAKPARGGGAPGVLILAARYLEYAGQQIPLRGLAQSVVGRDKVSDTLRHVRNSTLLILPTSMLAVGSKGGNLMVPQGGHARARIAQDVRLGGEMAASSPAPVATTLAPTRNARSGATRPYGHGDGHMVDAPATSAQRQPASARRDGVTGDGSEDGDPGATLSEEAELSVPAVPPGMGQVVFYRPGAFSWKAIGCTVKEEGRKISSLGSARWFVMVVRPGLHHFRVTGETSDELRLNVEPGDTQYVSCQMKMSLLIARPFIRPRAARDFHKELPDLHPVHDDDMGADGPEGHVLRDRDIRQALAAQGDVRFRLAGADRGEKGKADPGTIDPDLRRVGTDVLGKVLKETTGYRR